MGHFSVGSNLFFSSQDFEGVVLSADVSPSEASAYYAGVDISGEEAQGACAVYGTKEKAIIDVVSINGDYHSRTDTILNVQQRWNCRTIQFFAAPFTQVDMLIYMQSSLPIRPMAISRNTKQRLFIEFFDGIKAKKISLVNHPILLAQLLKVSINQRGEFSVGFQDSSFLVSSTVAFYSAAHHGKVVDFA